MRLSGGSSLLCPANLSDESVGLHSAVGVHLRHVHVIDEVDQSLGAGRAEAAARLLLQRRLHHLLQHHGRGVVVEGNGGHQRVFIQSWARQAGIGGGTEIVIDEIDNSSCL